MKAKDSNAKLTDQQLAENLAEKNEAGGELSEAELESMAGGYESDGTPPRSLSDLIN